MSTVRPSAHRPRRWTPGIGRSSAMSLPPATFGAARGRRRVSRFVTDLGRNFQVIYQQAGAHGQKVQTTGGNMAATDGAVGSNWA